MSTVIKEFILNNFELNADERHDVVCKEHIENKWGSLILPDGNVIEPSELQVVRIKHAYQDMYCRMPIDEHTICAMYVVFHEGELYYLDVNRAVELYGDMWNYGDNMNNETWNSYIIPDMRTCNHHLYSVPRSSIAAFIWLSKSAELTVPEAHERGLLVDVM